MKVVKKKIEVLKEKTTRGMSTLLVREVIMNGFAVLGQFFLIRLLLPKTFGIFAIILFIESTAELFTDIGFAQAIVQKKNRLVHTELSLIFTVRFLLSFSLFLVLFFVAPFLLSFFNQEDLQLSLMLRVLAVIMLIKPYRAIIIALLEREFSYNVISIIDLSGIVIYYLTAIICAVLGFQVWSLVFAVVAKETFETFLAFFVKKWKPSLTFKIITIKKILHFGAYMQIGAVFSYLSQATIPVLAGKLTGIQSVGYLNFGSNVRFIPDALVENFGRVAFSGFSRIQHDTKLLARSIEKSILLLNIVLFLFIVLMFCFSKDLVYFFFTEKWLPALPALYWFIGSTYFYGGNVVLGHGLLALGKSKNVFYVAVLTIFAQWSLPLLLIKYFGFTAIAIGIFCGTIVTFFGYIYFLEKDKLAIKWLPGYINSTCIMFLTFLFATLLNAIFPGGIIMLLLKISFTSLAYIIFGLFFSKKDFIYIIKLAYSQIKSFLSYIRVAELLSKKRYT